MQVATSAGIGCFVFGSTYWSNFIKGLLSYFSYFLAAVTISLSMPRTLILQYIPNSYTSGGVVSYTGAAVLGGAALLITFVVNAVFNALF